jgi:EmrB/QacA subfamily drug resistance transporter
MYPCQRGRVPSTPVPEIRYASAQGKWVLAAAILGSGIAFLDSSVVNTALPNIKREFNASLAGQQWVVTGYLLTLGSLLVVGGSLGDLFGRRLAFVSGLIGFGITSALCGIAPNLGVLIAARVGQGITAALLVPGSMAMIAAVFHPDDRAKAIGAWSGLAGVATAIGPFLGGWLIDTVSWRWVFLINPPLAAFAVWIALTKVPETRGRASGEPVDEPGDAVASGRLHGVDLPGAIALSLGLAGVVYALIEGPARRWPQMAVLAAVIGVSALLGFAVIERRSASPMVPMSLFHSKRFAGINAATFVMWGAIGAVFFLLTIHLQTDLNYSATQAGAATIPVTILMMLFSAKSGALAQRIGPRVPMIVGPLVVAAAFALMTRIHPGVSYPTVVFPAVIMFAFGLTITVAPLTATLIASVDDRHAGVGSAINNAVARVASLLAIAVLPALAGIAGARGASLNAGFPKAMWICAVLTAAGSLICALTIFNDN